LSPEDRRRQLLRVASDIIAQEGVDCVRIPHVAETAGVTRPVVYKFFPNREALIKSVLEEFRGELERRVPQDLEGPNADVESITQGFIDGACDAIEAKGPGAWQLLRSLGPAPDVRAISQEIRDGLVAPWLVGLRELTGADETEARALADMLLAGAGEVIQRWIDEELSRTQVASLLQRSILAVLREFAD
jgi:AcrR family transcriptional regulator